MFTNFSSNAPLRFGAFLLAFITKRNQKAKFIHTNIENYHVKIQFNLVVDTSKTTFIIIFKHARSVTHSGIISSRVY